MNTSTILALGAAVVFVAVTALTLNSIALNVTSQVYTYNKSQTKPYFLKGWIFRNCFEDTAECSLVVW